MTEVYIQSVKRLFHYYKSLADKAFEQIDDNAFHKQADDDSNSITIIMQHIAGNMLSRWTDFYKSDGEKEWRHRDNEFEDQKLSKTELMEFWEKGWKCCFEIIDNLKPEDLEKTIYIRNEAHTVIDAVNRQLAHYPYHVGQIVYLCRMYRKDEWKSLSIPKNKSNEFNQQQGNFLGDKK